MKEYVVNPPNSESGFDIVRALCENRDGDYFLVEKSYSECDFILSLREHRYNDTPTILLSASSLEKLGQALIVLSKS